MVTGVQTCALPIYTVLIAFCCISTGVFNFPKKEAAQIAINTVSTFLKGSQIEKVIFNVFKEDDEMIYQQLLNNKSK